MKQRRHYSSHRLSRDAERVSWLARGLSDSGSRTEDAWWENELALQIGKMLDNNQEEALNQALDRLQETHARAYDELADLIEAGVEGNMQNGPDGPRQTLLLALPILAWSRYSIPARSLPASLLTALRVQLKAHVLADDCRLALADFLYSPDQMPRGFVETRRFALQMENAALSDEDLSIPVTGLPETGHYISDLRYVLASVSVPIGHPMLRWQEVDGSRETALGQWQAQAGPGIQAILPGCNIQLLLPDAFFSAWRRADQEARGYALAATVSYLQAVLDLPASALRVVAAPYYEHRLVEWRISFGRQSDDTVLHGIVWPLLGIEDEGTDVTGEIDAILRQAGVGQILILDQQRLTPEYCDDCGAPLFPNAEGESVHTEMPELENDMPPVHLH
ncbi:MAG: DUF2863 family protein [Parasulfuritortus sp.]|jgi:hypothetical protein|nr:DUF2863 family protein [Parasulfuritortus sp.]